MFFPLSVYLSFLHYWGHYWWKTKSWFLWMIYTLEKKTQRERLNERLRSSLDSTQSRIRNAPFFLKFKIRSNAKIVLGFRIFSNFFLSTAEFKIFQQLFCFQPLGLRFFSNFLSFNHWKTIFLEKRFFLSTAGFKIFQQLFSFNRWV